MLLIAGAISDLDTIPRIGIALGVFIAGYVISRIARWAMKKVFTRRGHTESFSQVMTKIIGALLALASFLIAFTIAFPTVKPVDLLAGAGFLSVAAAFAFQDILENLLAGMLLLFRQPFQSGDQIEVLEQSGTVQAITIRETQIKTFDGKLVIIPNRDVYKSLLTIQTHFERRRIAFIVGIAYENDAQQARELIIEALKGLGIADGDPGPEALTMELAVSTVNIEARFWANSRQLESRQALDKAIRAVKKSLDENGIEMPCDIVALQATPSFRAAVHGDGELTPAGSVK